MIEDSTAYTGSLKHSVHEWLEVDISMIEFVRDRASELDFVSLETTRNSGNQLKSYREES